ncbi:MAG: toll/interleukin-1 receptor domain-containing protein [Chloroflexi bacterium]|nr:toll/interleukin-1 receptor domain-containing protein [Chloroflexota bacterium]
MKDILFLSHANPEDNEFGRWLALQLTRQGYGVWCDLLDLLGGEDFWKDIERVLRSRAIKFLYVLSRTSNLKPGPLNELQVAQNVMRDEGLKDFIVPLLIDDLPTREINIQLSRINVIPFTESWAKGLRQLLEKLQKDGTPTSPSFTPDVVATWWRNHFGADDGLNDGKEEHISNWFAIEKLPEKLFFHALSRSGIGLIEVPSNLPYPAFQHNRYLVTFAAVKDFEGHLGTSIFVEETFEFFVQDLLDGKVPEKFVPKEKRRDFVVRLLKQGFWKFAETSKLKRFALAQHTLCWWFPKDLVKGDKITFTGVDGASTWRSIVGYRTRRRQDGSKYKQYWHFGIQARPMFYPFLAYALKYHVLFSDDGVQHWRSKKRMHRARRRQCRDWWNPEWRDRTLATIHWLANGAADLKIELGSDVYLTVKCQPIPFASDVTFSDPISPKSAEEVDSEETEEMEPDEFADDEEEETEDE